MAEIAASILSISAFGIGVTRALYEFGSTASGAKEHTDYIARHVTLYAGVLELLYDRINDEEPIVSGKAYKLVEELSGQSNDLFEKIRNLLPDRAREDSPFLQKIKWNLKKSKVELLVAELDYLKSTVHLLVTVLFAGKRIRSSRCVVPVVISKLMLMQRCRAKQRTRTNGSLDCEHANVQLQSMKAQNAIVDHLNASNKLHDLQQVEQLDAPLIASNSAHDPNHHKCSDLVSQHNEIIPKLEYSFRSVEDPSERQALVLQDSTRILHSLLQQWTTLELEQKNGQAASSSPNQSSHHSPAESYHPYGYENTEVGYPGKFEDASDQLKDPRGSRKQLEDLMHDFVNTNRSSTPPQPTRLSDLSTNESMNLSVVPASPSSIGRGPAEGGLGADHSQKKSMSDTRVSYAGGAHNIWTSCPWINCDTKVDNKLAMKQHIRYQHDDLWPSGEDLYPSREVRPKSTLQRLSDWFLEPRNSRRKGVAPLKPLTKEVSRQTPAGLRSLANE